MGGPSILLLLRAWQESLAPDAPDRSSIAPDFLDQVSVSISIRLICISSGVKSYEEETFRDMAKH